MSIISSTAVLTISAKSTNEIAIEQSHQLDLRHVVGEGEHENDGREREVDAHVPLAAQDVDDALDRVVEGDEERVRALLRREPAASPSASGASRSRGRRLGALVIVIATSSCSRRSISVPWS